MAIATLYLITAVIFLGLDAVWLTTVIGPMFSASLGDYLRESPSLAVAAGFYLVYVVGVLWFVSGEGLRGEKPMGRVALDGALFGLFCYGTYELTSMAIMNRWTWTMVAADMAWGAAVTAVSAVIGLAVTRRIHG